MDHLSDLLAFAAILYVTCLAYRVPRELAIAGQRQRPDAYVMAAGIYPIGGGQILFRLIGFPVFIFLPDPRP